MLHIGFIGCGGIARLHASRLARMRNVRIVAASDVVEKTAREFASDCGASQAFTDHEKMLELDRLDAVWVCTPTFQHAAPVVAAARAGKHVFCEKPMALNLRDAHRMASACKRHGVRLAIGFVRRFDSEWGKLKQVISSGVLGRPLIWRYLADGRPQNPWFRDAGKGGGPLMDGAVHNYDFAMQIFGPVASVQASSVQFDPTSVGADTASVILNFASGDQHTLIWTWGMEPGSACASINDAIGPRGSLQFGMAASSAPSSYDPGKHGALTLKSAKGRERVYAYRLQDMFATQARHVVRCFDRDEQPLVGAEDGIAALRVATAVLKSGETRRTVRI